MTDLPARELRDDVRGVLRRVELVTGPGPPELASANTSVLITIGERRSAGRLQKTSTYDGGPDSTPFQV